jgi:DNA-binding FadR family transcriptional regulator
VELKYTSIVEKSNKKTNFIQKTSKKLEKLANSAILYGMKKQTENLVDQTEKQIYKYICRHGFTFGDALPKEEELAAELKVSRTITREALSRLKASGVIESRRRRGMILKKPDIFAGLEKLITYDLLDPVSKKEFAELRIVLELGLADLIYLRKNDQALQHLEAAAKGFFQSGVTSEIYGELEKEFHRQLFSLSGNELIGRFQLLLEPFFRTGIAVTQEKAQRAGNDHLELVNTLKNGSLTEWQAAIHRHLGHYFF